MRRLIPCYCWQPCFTDVAHAQYPSREFLAKTCFLKDANSRRLVYAERIGNVRPVCREVEEQGENLRVYTSVNDMVRNKFVFSIRDLTVKERMFREEKLTIEKAVCMARAA